MPSSETLQLKLQADVRSITNAAAEYRADKKLDDYEVVVKVPCRVSHALIARELWLQVAVIELWFHPPSIIDTALAFPSVRNQIYFAARYRWVGTDYRIEDYAFESTDFSEWRTNATPSLVPTLAPAETFLIR